MDSNNLIFKYIVVSQWLTTIIILLIIFTFPSCGPTATINCLKKHSPILEFTILPEKDTIKLGDTITLELRTSCFLTDWKNNEINSYNIDTLFPILRIFKLYDTINPMYSDSNYTFKFNYLLKNGNLLDGSKAKQIFYEVKNDSLYFNVKIIPNHTGFYGLSIWHNLMSKQDNALPLLSIKDNASDNCTHRLGGIMPNINNGAFTINRAIKRGFKPLDIWYLEANKEILWSVQNAAYYFEVVQ